MDVAHVLHIDSPTSNDGQHHPPSSAETAVAGAASHSRQARRWKASSRECCCLVLLLSNPAQGTERGSMRGEAPGPFVQGERRAEAPHLCTALKANASRGQCIVVVGERDPVRGLHNDQVAVRNMITWLRSVHTSSYAFRSTGAAASELYRTGANRSEFSKCHRAFTSRANRSCRKYRSSTAARPHMAATHSLQPALVRCRGSVSDRSSRNQPYGCRTGLNRSGP